jgi:lysozyme family protein
MSHIPPKSTLWPEYFERWRTCIPAASRIGEIRTVSALILRSQSRYESVVNKLPPSPGMQSMPWIVVALIHYREADLNFRTHLFNGDPLGARTVHEPAGQPITGEPPFTWEDSAWASLRYDHMAAMDYSTVAGICYALEDYNGWGYRTVGVPDPYLWAASNQQRPGKFASDGKFVRTDMDRQLGAITLLRQMITDGQVALRATPAAPAKISQLSDLAPTA